LAKLPVCVCFGISTPKQAAQVSKAADGVIIGSKLIQLLETDDAAMTATRSFIRETRKALDNIG
jgi:tryptophan synthase alpha chain